MKPNFFLVGAPRSGTTAMYNYLDAHPQVKMSSYKEPHYFGRDLVGLQFQVFRGKEDEYLKLFDTQTNADYVGEASVFYLFSKQAPKEIYNFNTNARILIMLRSPLEVLNSMFHHVKLTGDINYDSYTDLLADADKIRQNADSNSRLHFLLGEGVCYSEQVARYFDVFGREQVHVILYDQFRNQTAEEYRRVLTFLDIDPSFQPDEFAVINPARQVRNPLLHSITKSQRLVKLGSKMPFIALPIYRFIKSLNTVPLERDDLLDEVVNQLMSSIAPDVLRLSQLLGQDLNHWIDRG
ncbi:MAG: sulfotransferase family protein [Anaerolineae bacterium]